MNNERVVEMAVSIALTAYQFGDQADFLEALGNFAKDMAEKHRVLLKQERQDDDTARRLLDY